MPSTIQNELFQLVFIEWPARRQTINNSFYQQWNRFSLLSLCRRHRKVLRRKHSAFRFSWCRKHEEVFGRSKSELPSFVLCNIMKDLWMKTNRLEHVEVENCRINRKSVASHPNSQLELTIICQRKGGTKCLKIGGMLSISRHFTCTRA